MATHKKDTSSIGKLGEDIACEYLGKSGYRVLGRNYREKWGEIDVIARAGDMTLVFVEVKTLKGGGERELTPEDNLTSAKLRKLRRTCDLFANSHPDLINEKVGWRMDLITVTVPRDHDLTKDIKNCRICHYQNI